MGDSGIGKSELVRIIVSPPIGVEVNTTLPCIVAGDRVSKIFRIERHSNWVRHISGW